MRYIRMITVSVLLLLLAAPSAFACNPQTCFINTADLGTLAALLEHPEKDAPIIGYFFTGVGFTALGDENDHMAVRLDTVPGLKDLPEIFFYENENTHPNGYIAHADVCATFLQPSDTYFDLLPDATILAGDSTMVVLLSAPQATAEPQAVVLPGAAYKLMGQMNGFDLVVSDSVCGYLPHEQVQSTARSSGFPADLMIERPDYYAASFPLRFAIVDPEQDTNTVPLLPMPDRQAAPLAFYPCGAAVQILSDTTDYYRVRTFEHVGYMEKAALQLDGEKGKPILTGIQFYRISPTGETVALYTFPDVRAPKIGDIDTVDVEILGIAGNWYFVEVCSWEDDITYRGFMQADWRAGQGIDTMGTQELGVLVLPEGIAAIPLYDTPSTEGKILERYFQNTQLEVLKVVNTPVDMSAGPLEWLHFEPWYDDCIFQVRLDDRVGYMEARYVMVLHRTNPSNW